jgi:hypothetical protein
MRKSLLKLLPNFRPPRALKAPLAPAFCRAHRRKLSFEARGVFFLLALLVSTSTKTASAVTQNETNSGNSGNNSMGGTANVDGASKDLQLLLYNQEQFPVSSGADGKKFQSSQVLSENGYQLDGGLMDLTAQQTLAAACTGDAKGINICEPKNQQDASQAFDTAAQIYGVPSAAMICIRAQEEVKTKSKDSGRSGSGGDPKSPPPLSKAAEKANKALMDEAEKRYKKLLGISDGNTNGSSQQNQKRQSPVQEYAEYEARRFRTLLMQLGPTFASSKVLQRGNDDYFNLIRLLAVAKGFGEEEAKKLAQNPLGQLSLKGAEKEFADGVIDCMNKAAQAVGASAAPQGAGPGPGQ